MKQFLPILFIFLFTNVQAQYAVSPNDQTKQVQLDLSDEYISTKLQYHFLNTSTDNATLQWCIEQIAGPSVWEPQLCINAESGGCFSWGVSCNVDASVGLDVPFLVSAGDSSILDLGIRPNGEAGCGAFKIDVTPYGEPTNVLITAIYNFEINMNADCTEVPTEDLEQSKVKVFPNPTNSHFTITENEFVKKVEVYNLVGQMIFAQKYNNGDTFDLSNHPDGIYLVKMRDAEGQAFKSTKLVKR